MHVRIPTYCVPPFLQIPQWSKNNPLWNYVSHQTRFYIAKVSWRTSLSNTLENVSLLTRLETNFIHGLHFRNIKMTNKLNKWFTVLRFMFLGPWVFTYLLLSINQLLKEVSVGFHFSERITYFKDYQVCDKKLIKNQGWWLRMHYKRTFLISITQYENRKSPQNRNLCGVINEAYTCYQWIYNLKIMWIIVMIPMNTAGNNMTTSRNHFIRIDSHEQYQ